MNTPLAGIKIGLLRMAAMGLCLLVPFCAPAAFVYETAGEFIAAADLNGDGVVDVLVVDKLTGNARVAYAGTNGTLAWAGPFVTGVNDVSGCAAGHFVSGTREVVAVTSEALNRVNLFDLSNTNSAVLAATSQSGGLGPHALAGLASPFGSPPPANLALLIASTLNDPPAARLDIVTNYPIGSSTSAGQFAEIGPFEKANALVINTNGPTFAAGLVRGTNDALHLWQFTNSPAVLLAFSNLPSGSDYVFGNFNGETLPRFLFYQSGGTNLTIAPLVQTNGQLAFGPASLVILTQAVQEVFFLSYGTNGSALLEFADGVQAMSLSGGPPVFTPKYQSGLGAAGNVLTGIAPLPNGQFALFDSPPGSAASIHAQIVSFNGTSFTQRSSANLPVLTSRNTRANVWLFQLEPFVNGAPGFVESLDSPDWSDAVSVQTNSISVSKETDAGASGGLGSLSTTNLGAPPAGTGFALENQYSPVISLFAYGAPQARDSVTVNISPPPGTYGSPLTIALSGNGLISYRVVPAGLWQTYSTPFAITNDATIQYFGVTLLSQTRSHIQSAAYSLNSPPRGVVPPPASVHPTNTNPPPVLGTNQLILSPDGTIFYGRVSATNSGTIWAINFDGSGETYITTGFRPRASRDGRYLAFLRDGNPLVTQGNAWVRNLLTGQEAMLFSNTNYTIGYDWDRSGTNLVFDWSCWLWSITPGAAASQLPLATDCYDDAPVVNPVDGRLAFHNLNGNAAISGLYVTTSNLATRVNLNLSVPGASWPAWSPDGQRLVFVDGNNPNSAFTADAGKNLYVAGGDGTALSQISGFTDSTNGFPHGALWSPDGTALVGAGTIFGTNGLWVIPLTPELDDCDGPPILLPTSPGDRIDFAGSIVVAPPVQPPVGQLELLIRPDPTAVVVFWSTNSAGFTLEYATNLSAATVWTPLPGPYERLGVYFQHAEAKAALQATKFFRLRYSGTAPVAPGPLRTNSIHTNAVALPGQ